MKQKYTLCQNVEIPHVAARGI